MGVCQYWYFNAEGNYCLLALGFLKLGTVVPEIDIVHVVSRINYFYKYQLILHYVP